MKKLNLGCGDKIFPKSEGWDNLDFRPLKGVDIVCDLNNQEIPVPGNYYDYVFANDILEHFPLDYTDTLMKKIWRVIKKGGRLEAQVPNTLMNFKMWLDGSIKTLSETQSKTHRFSQMIFGKQDYIGNYHFQLFDKERLGEIFESNGFVILKEWEHGRGLNILGERV